MTLLYIANYYSDLIGYINLKKCQRAHLTSPLPNLAVPSFNWFSLFWALEKKRLVFVSLFYSILKSLPLSKGLSPSKLSSDNLSLLARGLLALHLDLDLLCSLFRSSSIFIEGLPNLLFLNLPIGAFFGRTSYCLGSDAFSSPSRSCSIMSGLGLLNIPFWLLITLKGGLFLSC